MKNLIILFAASFIGQMSARAEVITCNFTEPFFTIKVDLVKKTITRSETNYEEDAVKNPIATKVVSKKAQVRKMKNVVLSPVVEFSRYMVMADGKPYMQLQLDYQGSDGMSEYVYPYEATLVSVAKGDFQMRGGCYSQKLPRILRGFETELISEK